MSEFSQKLQPWSSLHNVKEAQQVWGISTHLSWSERLSQRRFSVSLKWEGVSTNLGRLPQLCEACLWAESAELSSAFQWKLLGNRAQPGFFSPLSSLSIHHILQPIGRFAQFVQGTPF